MLWFRFFVDIFCHINKVPFYFNIWEFLSWVVFWIKCIFCIYWDNHMFFLFFPLMWWIILIILFYFLAVPYGMQDPSSQPGIKPMAPEVEARSLNHWRMLVSPCIDYFRMLNQPCIPGMNHSWSLCIIFFSMSVLNVIMFYLEFLNPYTERILVLVSYLC